MLVKDYIKKHGDTHFQSVLTKKGKQKLFHPNWILTDMRFPNEMEAVVERGGITIRVVRPKGLSEIAKQGHYTLTKSGLVSTYTEHPSETALDDAEFDYEIINDGRIEDIVSKVREILVKEKII